jgi:hypothetical protein
MKRKNKIIIAVLFVSILTAGTAHALLPLALGYFAFQRVMVSVIGRVAVRGLVHRGAAAAASEALAAQAAKQLIARASARAAVSSIRLGSSSKYASWLSVGAAVGLTEYLINRDDSDETVLYKISEQDKILLKVDFTPPPWANGTSPPLEYTKPASYNPSADSQAIKFNYPLPIYSGTPTANQVSRCITVNGNSTGFCSIFPNFPNSMKYYVDVFPYFNPANNLNYEILLLGCMVVTDCARRFADFQLAHLTNSQTQFKYKDVEADVSNLYFEQNKSSPNFGAFVGHIRLRFTKLLYVHEGTEYWDTPEDTNNAPIEFLIYPKRVISDLLDPEEALETYPELGELPTSSKYIADLADTLWRDASEADPDFAVPYDPLYPVTVEDIETALDGDYIPLKNIIKPDRQSFTEEQLCMPPHQVIDGKCVGEATGIKPDLGADPNIGPPILEDIPTVQMILDPIFSLFPSLKNFSAPSHNSVCPVGSFDFAGHNFVMDSHCEIIESQRGALGVFFILAWTIAGLIVVLKA